MSGSEGIFRMGLRYRPGDPLLAKDAALLVHRGVAFGEEGADARPADDTP